MLAQRLRQLAVDKQIIFQNFCEHWTMIADIYFAIDSEAWLHINTNVEPYL